MKFENIWDIFESNLKFWILFCPIRRQMVILHHSLA